MHYMYQLNKKLIKLLKSPQLINRDDFESFFFSQKSFEFLLDSTFENFIYYLKKVNGDKINFPINK